jgi:AcrR family transcriptional regulator
MHPPPASETQRADATRNRRALLDAARVVFGDRGLEASLDEIARTAGVGNATLYRHFPSRCALVAAVFAETLHDVAAAAQKALANPDGWEGFSEYVTFLCQLQATDRGLADLLTTAIAGAPELEELRGRAYDDFVRIVDRAKQAGALREDFRPEDLVLLLMANAGLVHRTAGAAPAAWQRMLSYTLDGLRESAATSAPPSAGEVSVLQAMRNRAGLFDARNA